MGKKYLCLLMGLLTLTSVMAQDTKMNIFIDKLMSKMSVDEKIGQLNLASSWTFRSALRQNSQEESLDAISKGQMGALYGFKNVPEMIRLQKMAVEKSKNHIPFFYGMDCLHGLETTFPIPLALSASWDTTMIGNVARHIAHEVKAMGINWVFSPMVDICRDARWGRVAEGSGEDQYLGGEIAKTYVRAYEGEGVMTSLKHFALYGGAESGKDYNPVYLSRQEMMNGYMRPYYEAVKAGCSSVMSSFNEFEGIPATCNSYLLKDILRDQWGFKGFVVSDATAIAELQAHGLGDLQTVSARALKAGVDMDMNSNGYIQTLKKSLEEGKVSMSDIDNACRRILEAKYKLGLFDNPYRYLDSLKAKGALYTDETRAFERKAAQECPVLLKNEGNILPLRKDAKIALVGPLANDAEDMQGSWAVSSHSKESVTILQGIQEALQGGSVTYKEGSWLLADSALEASLKTSLISLFIHNMKPVPVHQRPLKEMIDEAVASTANADVIIAALGETNDMSGEGASRADITVPEPQRELLKALKQTGKSVVLVLTTGRPLVLTEEDKTAEAILCTWALGDQAGHAIADILFGDVNPSGKLTMSFPRAIGQLPIYYNHKSTGRPHPDYAPYRKFTNCYIDVINAPLYPFGYGLSYTTFKYSPVSLANTIMSKENGTTMATVSVTNTGSREGMTTVQLYIHAQTSTSTRPIKELRAFKKINLKAGETQQVSFHLTADDLKYFNHELEYVCEPGKYDIMIGDNSNDVQTAVLNVM